MATSGTTTFNLYRDQIIRMALRKVGVKQPTALDISFAADALNVLVKSLDNDVRLWQTAWYTKTYAALSSEVTGSDGNVYTCILGHTSSATNKPVTGAEWPIYWVKYGSTGGVWATSTAYTSTGDFSVDSSVYNVEKMIIRTSGDDTPINIVNRFGYGDWTDKSDFGIPCEAWIDYSQSTPKVRLDRLPDSTDYVIQYLGVNLLEDFSLGNHTGDMPTRWLKALVYMLADDLVEEYLEGDAQISVGRRITAKRDKYLEEAKRRDNETTDESIVTPYYC